MHSYLVQHPEICMTREKETHFFCWDATYEMGLRWYGAHFEHCGGEYIKVIGEATPDYMYLPKVPERIHRDIPGVKLIFVLRNPVDRAYSHYWHEVALGWETVSFEEAVKREKERIGSSPRARFHFSYLDRGRYSEHLKRFLEYIPKTQVSIVLYEELKDDKQRTLGRLFDWLGVDPEFEPADMSKKNVGGRPSIPVLQRIFRKWNPLIKELPYNRLNPGLSHSMGVALATLVTKINLKGRYPPMAIETRKGLSRHFDRYNRELGDLFDLPVDHWGPED